MAVGERILGHESVDVAHLEARRVRAHARRRTLDGPVVVVVAVLSVLVALIAFFPLGGYRLLPTKYENCFTPGTPCLDIGGEQRGQ